MSETLILVRHAETAWNKEQRLQGSKDIPLSPDGITQSEKLAEKLMPLGISHIVGSTLKRASQTGEIIAARLQVPFSKDPGFNERSYGQLEGRIWPEVQKELQETGRTLDDFAEPFTVFTNRVREATERTLGQFPADRILIVCHGGVLRVLLDYLGAPSSDQTNIGYELPNASFFVFTKKGEQWTPTTP